jgi:phosphatidylethanolamine-binding protein (PEBP) family uncharacterized protein
MKQFLILLALPLLNNYLLSKKSDSDIILSSPAFVNKGAYPKLFTCDSLGISPPLSWNNIPSGTKSFAITMHHYPKEGDKHVYMVLYNIPNNVKSLEAGEKNIGTWGANTQNKDLSYSPPCSKGPGPKSYIITIYALSEILHFNNSDRVNMNQLMDSIQNILLSKSSLEVIYSR